MENSQHPLSLSPPSLDAQRGEEETFSRPRSASVQTRRSWPLLPALQVINSSDNGSGIRHTVQSPAIDTVDSQNTVSSSSESEENINSDFDEKEKGVTYKLPNSNEDDRCAHEEFNDRRRSTIAAARRDSAGTLVEAALDQAEARDRHVRFQDHIAEAGTLVQRMISTRYPSISGSSEQRPRRSTFDECAENTFPDELDTVEHQSNHSSLNSARYGGGSVLASLMKLEAQRRHPSVKKKKQLVRKRKDPKKTRMKKPASMYNLNIQSSTDSLPATGLKRPNMAHRPTSWLSTITTSNHLVPSLQKRKMTSSVSMSRRSSIDSMFTTASQFEPITLEDRIRITFEIANILQKQEFLRKLVKCLMLYGAPAHRLEYILREVSRTLGVDAEYVYIPNVMFLTFFDQTTHTTETHFIRSSLVFDMHKLGEVYRLEKLVSHGEVSVDEALEFIDKVVNEPQFYPVWLNPFVYALASFCGCVMFYGGTFKEGGLSAALAIFFATYELYSGRYLSFQPIWEITVCILIGFVSRAVWRYGFCFTPVAFASFIVILPGYSMAVALIELVSRQLVSGVVRMVYAIMYSFLLGYGIEMGSEIFGKINPESVSSQGQAKVCIDATSSSTCVTVIPQAYYFLTVPLFALTYCIYLRARLPRWPYMIFVAVSGFVVNYILSCYANAPSQVLQVVPAFTVGLLGNLLTKFTGKMSLDAVILGIFYMVPGSLGLKSALGFFGSTDNSEFANQGAGFALSMIETSIGITVGLFIATLVVYPKGTSHTPLMSF
ncbi:Pheromone-regulated membrane protein 10 [Choanephora cucurbitarum]|uniref:Pheromone-regulated membrane protein 10 n=1 Tax=Choanephora cucurbitarum TaxID=101091 RepID=A0A1C7NR61_9FUNG|nr:Pheromone-regulated membrane protein 10 [Choanephora cucurbitarum]